MNTVYLDSIDIVSDKIRNNLKHHREPLEIYLIEIYSKTTMNEITSSVVIVIYANATYKAHLTYYLI